MDLKKPIGFEFLDHLDQLYFLLAWFDNIKEKHLFDFSITQQYNLFIKMLN